MDDFIRNEHEAYGMLRFSRVSGGDPNLFGTSVKCNERIVLEVHEASEDRGLHKDWFHSGRQLIEVEMSFAQFAEAITSMNASGIPCTLKRVMGEVKAPVEYMNKRKQFVDEFSDSLSITYEDANKALEAARSILESGKAPSKSEKQELLGLLRTVQGNIGGNMKFMAKQWDEQLDRSTMEAKCEIEAFCQHKMENAVVAAAVKLDGSIPPQVMLPENDMGGLKKR